MTPTTFDITATVSLLQHPLYQSITILEVNPLSTHFTSYTLYMTSQSHFMTSFHSIYDITATAFMTSDPLHTASPPVFMASRPLSLWHHRHYLLNTVQLYLTSNTRCRHNTTTISEIRTSICVSLWSHTLYRSYNMHCICDMAPTICKAQYTLYMTSHPWFMTSQHSIRYISLLYLISNWFHLRALPLYLCHQTQIINHITPIVHMITQTQYVWYHTNTYDITSNLYHITPWYELHTHCSHVITPRIPVIASTAAELLECIEYTTSAICVISDPLYVWHHMNSMWHHNNSLRHHKTVFMTSQPHYAWHQPHCIWHHIHSTWDLTALWLWKNTYYVFEIIFSVYDI